MKLNRRDIIRAGIAGTLGLTLGPSHAANGKPFRIYMILFRGETPVETGFKEYFESKGISAEFVIRNVDRDVNRVPDLIREARSMRPDLIYLWGTPVTAAVCGVIGKIDPQKHVTDIPIVFTMVSSPVGAKLIANGGVSGRNITGVSHVVPIERQIDAIRAYRSFNSLAVAFNPSESNSKQSVDELKEISKRAKFTLIEFPISLDDKKQPMESTLPNLIGEIAHRKPDFLYLGADSFLGQHRKLVTETALQLKVPVYSATEVMLRDGKALFGLVSPYRNVGQLAAYKATLILQGDKKPNEIAVETLPSFSYIVNMTVAARINYYPSLKVVNFAEVIS
ncbi:MAG: ABC transporter substrate-binding protein [Steroidobacteraceae bacterium]